jgi:hypothetical protein
MKLHILNHNETLLKLKEYKIKMFCDGKNIYNRFPMLNFVSSKAKSNGKIVFLLLWFQSRLLATLQACHTAYTSFPLDFTSSQTVQPSVSMKAVILFSNDYLQSQCNVWYILTSVRPRRFRYWMTLQRLLAYCRRTEHNMSVTNNRRGWSEEIREIMGIEFW